MPVSYIIRRHKRRESISVCIIFTPISNTFISDTFLTSSVWCFFKQYCDKDDLVEFMHNANQKDIEKCGEKLF